MKLPVPDSTISIFAPAVRPVITPDNPDPSPKNELAVIMPVVLIESVGPKVDVDPPPDPTPKVPLYTAPVI